MLSLMRDLHLKLISPFDRLSLILTSTQTKQPSNDNNNNNNYY